MTPILGYIDVDSLIEISKGSNHTAMVTARKHLDKNMQRVAITAVPASLIEVAYADMTATQRELLAPQWRGSVMPTADDLLKISEHFIATANLLTGASEKLRVAAERAKEMQG